MPSEITAEEFNNLPSPSDFEHTERKQLWGFCESCHCQQIAVCGDCKKLLRETADKEFTNLQSQSDFKQAAKRFRDERNHAWDEFLDLSCQAGYNIKNTIVNRILFMAGFESGKELNSRELNSLTQKLAQVRFENWENVGWGDDDNEQ